MFYRIKALLRMDRKTVYNYLERYEEAKKTGNYPYLPYGYNLHLKRQDKKNEGNLWMATFTCNDHTPTPQDRKSKEDLEYMVVTKFGKYIVKQWKTQTFKEDGHEIQTITDNPLLKYQALKKPEISQTQSILLNKNSLQEIAKSIRFQATKLKYADIKDWTPRFTETSKGYKIEIGKVEE